MQGIRHTNGSQARVEPRKVLSVVSSDVNILVVHGDEISHEEISKGISKIPGRNRTRSLQETSADTGWKRVGMVSRINTKARESILEEDLAKNVSLSLHNSFCLNGELKVKVSPNQAMRLQEYKELMRSFEQLKAWEEIVISSDDEEALLRQITVPNSPGPSTSKARNTKSVGSSVWVS